MTQNALVALGTGATDHIFVKVGHATGKSRLKAFISVVEPSTTVTKKLVN